MEKEILELNPQAAYNEARKINRFLKEFERFESILGALADYDKTVKELEQQRGKLEEEIQTRTKEYISVDKEVALAKVQLSTTFKELESIKERTKISIENMEKETRIKLEEMKKQAKDEVEKSNEDLKTVRPQVYTLRAEKSTLEMELARLKNQASTHAKAVADAFKVLS